MSNKTTMMLVSKSHKMTVKRLYKIIFQLHRSLPDQMRSIGDAYVRSEFKLHMNASPEYASTFLAEWGVSFYD
jgi:transcription termination factor NusB